ncbi:Ig-like domain-containing protein [Reichenbachiella versicolor]|uniref:Ig-like domain-containing protein n=1 Tax=Reichenbachiella versicolor TaxID=1821036 RepID=UPI000D6E3BF2|nr:Ig-like domain-containing protein [Reichenbachiella versicolor]
MNQLKKTNLLSIALAMLVAVMMISCDEFRDDASPEGEELLTLDVDRQIRAGGSILFDLSKVTNTNKTVEFSISQSPTKGDLSFLNPTLLKYQGLQNFNEGKDLFVVEILDGQQVLDEDTIVVEIIKGDSIGCFAGAQSDLFQVYANEPDTFNVLTNDGICPEKLDSVGFSYEQIKNGKLTLVNDGKFVYEPNPKFVGSDSFVYTLYLIDEESNVYESMAQATIFVQELDSQNVCVDKVWPNIFEHYTFPLQETYPIQIQYPDPACSLPPVTTSIIGVSNGSALLVENDIVIVYQPEAPVDSLETIEYQLTFEDGSQFTRTISMTFTSDRPCEDQFYALEDTLTFQGYPIEVADRTFDPVDNDFICADINYYEMFISSQPEFGKLTVNENREVEYEYSLEDVFGETIVSDAEYTLCIGNVCDKGKIHLRVEIAD